MRVASSSSSSTAAQRQCLQRAVRLPQVANAARVGAWGRRCGGSSSGSSSSGAGRVVAVVPAAAKHGSSDLQPQQPQAPQQQQQQPPAAAAGPSLQPSVALLLAAAAAAIAAAPPAAHAAAGLDAAGAHALEVVLRPLFALSTVLYVVRIPMTWYPTIDGTKLPWLLAYAPTEPVLKATRSVVPLVGGVDVTPIVWVALISFFNEILLGPQGLLMLVQRQSGGALL